MAAASRARHPLHPVGWRDDAGSAENCALSSNAALENHNWAGGCAVPAWARSRAVWGLACGQARCRLSTGLENWQPQPL